jgi:DNA-binding GntR family transcriptional regulator
VTRSLTSAERALHALRELILGGELTPGARLGEVELADRLGVSRTPVREALSRLAAEGIVEIQPNRGARVATWTVAELEGVFELRSTIEPLLTAYAVPQATAADIEELDDLAHRMADVGCPGPRQNLDALVPLNRAFHDRLVALAGHPTLATALAGAIHPPIVLRNFHAYDEASLRRSLAHHAEIVAALRAGDATWARAVMTAHIHNARAVMVRAATEAAGAEPAAAPHKNQEAS